jgi:hypothetical protein
MLIDPSGQALLDRAGRRLAWSGVAQPAHSHIGGRLFAAIMSRLGDLLSGPHRRTSQRQIGVLLLPTLADQPAS